LVPFLKFNSGTGPTTFLKHGGVMFNIFNQLKYIKYSLVLTILSVSITVFANGGITYTELSGCAKITWSG